MFGIEGQTVQRFSTNFCLLSLEPVFFKFSLNSSKKIQIFWTLILIRIYGQGLFFIKFYNYYVASSASYKSFSLFCKINLNCPILKGLQTNLQYWKLLQKISREPCKSICSLFCQFNPSPVVSDSFFVSLFQTGLHVFLLH